jgi:NitT/TauT family transport system ATP-binding protein
VIEAQNLAVAFSGKGESIHALGPLSFQVAAGEFVSFVGPSGCGKTTLARTMANINRNFDGSLTVGAAGDDVVISTVFQDYGVFPWKTAAQNLEFPLRERGHSAVEAGKIAREWLGRLRIDQFADYYPHQLSGGMKQRVAISRALSVRPDFLILDEPFAAIDAQLRELLQEELMALQQETKMTTVLFTHSYDEAVLLSDRVFVLTSRPAAIKETLTIPFARPRTPEVRRDKSFGATVNALRTSIRRDSDED